jgi:ssDNA-binding Zn-finger/Zn-ribbon topoisomerase 1
MRAPIKCSECGKIEIIEADPRTEKHLFETYQCPECAEPPQLSEPRSLEELDRKVRPAYII